MNFDSEAKIDSVDFSFYTPEQIKNLSVVEINNPIAFDNKTPIPFGLYDQRMGVNPMDRVGICPTCDGTENDCPGHLGHINLVLPIYNVFLIKDIHKILQSKCFQCHRFTLTPSVLKNFKLILKCLNLGLFDQYAFMTEFEESTLSKKTEDKPTSRKTSRSTNKSDSETNQQTSINQRCQEFIAKISTMVIKQKSKIKKQIKQLKRQYDCQQTSYSKEMKALLIKDFFSKAKTMSQCPYCNETKPTIKKEGSNKFVIKEKDKQSIVNPQLVKQHFQELFDNEESIIKLLFGKFSKDTTNKKGYSVKQFNSEYYFIECLPVSPNRFRPESHINDQVYLHAHTVLYTKVLQINNDLISIQIENKDIFSQQEETPIHKKAISKWIELQETVNILFDSSINQKASEKYQGIKQILEKKEGIFRMKIMGKRVNYSARSVISPDPYLQSDEIGIPLFMAKTLTFPETVNHHNLEQLQTLIRNGPHNYPGAIDIQDKKFKKILENSSASQRELIAQQLAIDKEQKIVHRHIQDGDVILFNRQPTLHKPSLMAFKVKVLPKELTIRMHYVNCGGFNADFDGDEMNVHILQNYQARSEGLNLALCDRQYILPTNKNPIRGFIQDFIFASVFITQKDQFFNKSDYTQLLFEALQVIIDEDPLYNEIILLQPAIIKPVKLWSGKQLFSNIIDYIAKYDFTGLEERTNLLNLKASCRVNKNYFDKISQEESEALIQNNILIKGLVDKSLIGASSFGLIHTFYELFGHVKTKMLTTAITRLCINFLKIHGFSCGLNDLILSDDSEIKRKEIMEQIHEESVNKQAKFLNISHQKVENYFETINQKKMKNSYQDKNQQFLQKLEQQICTQQNNELDQIVKNSIANLQSEVSKISVGTGLKIKFPLNSFSCMVLTGAKGSVLNHSQVSCNLGQQELEGKRVPLMTSGKTLPSFLPYDPNPRCGGFIGDRFLTGLRSQEFYFHCMAGREGLVDTAVKTSRSGYLQRILVKNLESLIVEYDNTVRDIDDKSLIQYYYGEDSLDPTKVNSLENMDYIINNYETIRENYQREQPLKFLKEQEVNLDQANPYQNLGTISNKAKQRLDDFLKNEKKRLKQLKIDIKEFKRVYYWQYFKCLVDPGESVGAIAAQSFGEPSTQMTLNTFHLAGHGGANVTLGVPRLKELMTTKNTKQSIMTVPFKKNTSKKQIEEIMKGFESLDLLQWIKQIKVSNKLNLIDENNNVLSSDKRSQKYIIEVIFENLKDIQKAFQVKKEQFNLVIKKFIEKYSRFLQKTLAIKTNKKVINNGQKEEGKKTKPIDEKDVIDEENFVLNYESNDNIISINLDMPLSISLPPIINTIESILQGITIKKQKGITGNYLMEENDQQILQLEGLNFKALWKRRQHLDVNKIQTNDVNILSEVYGIEASRNAWIKEVQTVFSHYGIKVDYRHAYLVSDHLTFPGHLNPMSRIGIKYNNSPMLKMSFETTMQFLIEATKNLEKDELKSASSCLVVGNPIKQGSGSFEIRQKIKQLIE